MANYNEKQLLVSLKAYSRANPLALDSSSVWESLADAQSYIKSPTAYGGQIITVLQDDGKYHTYTLQPSDAGYVLEEASGSTNPADGKQYVVVGATLPTEGQEQGVVYIETTTNTGNIWDGNKWVKVFHNVEAKIVELESGLNEVKQSLEDKAPLANPQFTGTVTIDGNEVAVKSYVDGLIANLSVGMGVPSVVDADHPIPEDYKAGQTYRVSEAGTYVGQECEVGDLIIVLVDHNADTASNADFIVVQSNIDGAITSTADVTTVGEIVVFDSVTGKVIKGSGINVASLNDAIAKAHEHTNKIQLDSFDKTQTELLDTAKADAQELVNIAKGELQTKLDGKADKGTTLADYGITDAYTSTVIDGKLQTITDNLNTKVTADEVDVKIAESKTAILAEAKGQLDARVGNIPEDSSIADYVKTMVGAGGADTGEAIEAAKQDAINTSKQYADSLLAVVEF